MKFAMCNEFCEGWDLDAVFALARDTGYDGVEIAPFTLADHVADISSGRRAEIRDIADRHGLAVVGLHWLLISPEGMYVNHPDAGIRDKTQAYFRDLIEFCADIGGDRMIIGSPKQRNVTDGDSYEAVWDRTVEFYRGLLGPASDRGVTLCIEPLAREETNFLNTAADGIRMIEEIGHENFRLILDCKAMADEDKAIPDIIRDSAAHLHHFHVNDDSKSYPGTGTLDFPAIMHALSEVDYTDWVSLEVFDFTPGAEKIAREGLAHVKASLPFDLIPGNWQVLGNEYIASPRCRCLARRSAMPSAAD